MIKSSANLGFGAYRNVLGVNIKGSRGNIDDQIMEGSIKLASQAGFTLPDEIVLDDSDFFRRKEREEQRPLAGYALQEQGKDKIYLNPYRQVFVPKIGASTSRPDHVLLHEITHNDNQHNVPDYYAAITTTRPNPEEVPIVREISRQAELSLG